MPREIAKSQSIPQPTISYPYKLFPNQPSTDCAIGENTNFPFDQNPRKITTDILRWNELEKEVWLTICEGKAFDSLSDTKSDVNASWIDQYNKLQKETELQGHKCNLDMEMITISKLQESLDCFKKYLDQQEIANQEINESLNNLSQKLENNAKISKNFLNTILLREPFRSALPNKVIIKNVIFTEEIDLSSTNINVELHLEKSLFKKRVNFSNSQFSKSLYLDKSTFEEELLINNAFVEGGLFLREVTLKPNLDSLINRTNEINLINLSRIKVNGEVQITKQKLQINDYCHNVNLIPLNLTAAQIAISLDLQGSKWIKSENSYCNNAKEVVNEKESVSEKELVNAKKVVNIEELVLVAVKIEDALFLNSETEFRGLNLANSQVDYFIVNIPRNEYQKIDNIDTLIDYLSSQNILVKLFKRSKSNQNKPILNKFIKLRINFEDAQINNFQVNPIDNGLKFFPNFKYRQENVCNFNLDGFVYQDINFTGFNLLNFCLNSKYLVIINRKLGAGQKDNSINSIQKLANQLLQPLEQLTIISRDLGHYQVEDELLYRRKRLELVIAQENNLFLESLQLWIGDLLYGFGYQRTKILYSFFLLLILGIGFAYWVLREKQKNLLQNTIELRNHEIDDELYEIEDQLTKKERYKIIDFQKIKPHLDYVDRIIFDGRINSNEPEKIYLGFKPELDSNEFVKNKILGDSQNQETDTTNRLEFVKIRFDNNYDQQDIREKVKYIVHNVDERNKNNRKVGICANLLPNSGLYLVYSIEGSEDQFHTYSLEAEKEENFSFTSISFKQLKEMQFNNFSITSSGITWQTFLKSLVYSLDSLIPLIELDQQLKDFIIEDSQGLPKGYFIFQQILGTIAASILLPILFITGL